MPTQRVLLACCALAATCAAHVARAADHLLITDDVNDRVMLFSAADGSLIDANWLTEVGAVGWSFSTPKEAVRVGDEYWVSDQVADSIHRFDLSRVFLSSITTGFGGVPFDNLRGLGVDNSRVYVCHAGSPINSTVFVFAHDGTPIGAIPTGGGAFDAEPRSADELLVSNDATTDAVQRWSIGGPFIGNFVTGVNTPQQVVVLGDGSVLVADSLAAVGSRGLRHFNADGTLRAFVSVASIANTPTRGVMLLDDGGYLLGTSAGVYKAVSDGAGGFTLTAVLPAVGAQYITRIPGPCPADLDGDGVVGASDLANLLGGWGLPGPADLDGDGAVGPSDLASLLGSWGPC